MKVAKVLLGVAMLAVPTVLIAINVGTFQCNSCSFTTPVSGHEESAFIRTEVNPHVPAGSWVDGSGRPHSVTLCNSTNCADYTYIKLTGLWALDRRYPNNNGGNGGNPGTPGGGTGGGTGGGDGGGLSPLPGNDDPFCFSAFPCNDDRIG